MADLPPVPLISVVIPMLNEAGNILPLVQEVSAALRAYNKVGEHFEIIAVDDGSDDTTPSELLEARKTCKQLRIIRHDKRLGMSAAIRNGVRRALAEWVVTMDGDRQNDPADAPRLIDLAWQGGMGQKILVAGLRAKRRDTLGKRYASRFANAIRRSLLNDNCPDTGCSLKVFPRDSYLELPFFNGLHRFMPALFKHYGHEIRFLPVNDRPREVGVSKSDFVGRAIKGLWDLFGVIWIMRRTPAPDRGREV